LYLRCFLQLLPVRFCRLFLFPITDTLFHTFSPITAHPTQAFPIFRSLSFSFYNRKTGASQLPFKSSRSPQASTQYTARSPWWGRLRIHGYVHDTHENKYLHTIDLRRHIKNRHAFEEVCLFC
jgi:hypothetical protein